MLPAPDASLKAQEGVTTYKQGREYPDKRADFPPFPCRSLEKGEGDQTEAEACGDAKRERCGDECKEGRKGLREVAPVDARHGSAHECPDDDQGWSSGKRGYGGDGGRAKHCPQETGRDHEVPHPRASPGRYARRALDITGNG